MIPSESRWERVEKDPGYVRRTGLPDMQALGAAGAHTPPAHSTSKERGEQGGTAVAPNSSRSGEWGMCEDPSLSTGHSRAPLLESGRFSGAGARTVPLHR